MIKAIIFDIGGVIAKGLFGRIFCSKVAQAYGLDVEHAFLIYNQTMREYELGKESQLVFFNKFSKRLGVELELIKTKKMFSDSLLLNKDVFELVKTLSKKYDCHIASDNYKELVHIIKNKWNVKQYFKIMIFSNEIGISKRDRKFFDGFLKHYSPKECIFIDDHDYPIETAKKVGFHTIKYVSLEQLKREFKRLGII